MGGGNPRSIATPNGERLVVLPEDVFERLHLQNAAEMAEDVAAYDAIKRRLAAGEEEFLPCELVDRMPAGENPVRLRRGHRGMTVAALAEKAGITQPCLSQTETGGGQGTPKTTKKIAEAPNIGLADLA